MTTKTKIYIGVSVVALVGGYFIYKALRPKKPILNGTKDNTKSTTTTTPSTTTTTSTTTTDSGECKRYIVSGVSNTVNIRSTPSTSLKEIDFLFKGSTISAKPSTTSGWMELCDMKGFISSQYLNPFVPKSTKCVLQKGLKWDSPNEKGWYYQNFKDLRSGLWYETYRETKKPFNYDLQWSKRNDNKDVAEVSTCSDFLPDGSRNPKCVINRRELEEFYQSGNVC